MPILMILLVLAVIYLSVIIPVIALIAVGATIYWLVTLDWEKERAFGIFVLSMLIAAILITGFVYAKYGFAGVCVLIFIIMIIWGLLSD